MKHRAVLQQRPARGAHPLATLPVLILSPAQLSRSWPVPAVLGSPDKERSKPTSHFLGKLLPQGWRKSWLLPSSRCFQPKPRGLVPHRSPEETHGWRERLVHPEEAQPARPKLPGRISCSCSIQQTCAVPVACATIPVPAPHCAAGAVPAFPRRRKSCQPTPLWLTAGRRSGPRHTAISPASSA